MPLSPILTVEHLKVSFFKGNEESIALHDLSFSVPSGKILGLIGGSGSGKTLVALSLLGLAGNFSKSRSSGTIRYFSGDDSIQIDLSNPEGKDWQKIRRKKAAMVFQNPGTALNPVFTCGNQLLEVIGLNIKDSKKAQKQQAVLLLKEVGFPDPERIFKSYPHELSGGQKQRVMIAIALASNPELLIADEPTSSLDAETQKGILELFKKVKENRKISILLISHDMFVVKELADELLVLKEGRIVDGGLLKEVLSFPRNDYTKSLVFSSGFYPLKRTAGNQAKGNPLVEVKEVQKKFVERGIFNFNPRQNFILNNITFKVNPGETVGLVGPSGCGKTTLARIVLGLLEPSSGTVRYKGNNIFGFSRKEMREFRKNSQVVFQDPYASLNPAYTIGDAISEPLLFHKITKPGNETLLKVHGLLEKVGLGSSFFGRFPHELSGGQLQRANIARAVALNPQFIICDEPTSSLDALVQNQILELLKTLQLENNMAMLFVSHNLALVQNLCDHVLQLKNGNLFS